MLSVISRFMKEFRQVVLTPVLAVGLAALALYLLGMVPAYLPGSPGEVKEYDSLEEASSELGFDIIVPVYFPNYLAWPPHTIRGQSKPLPMAQMTFLASDRRTEILLIYEMVSDSQDFPESLPWIKTVDQKITVAINNNQGELIVGKRANGDAVNGVHWRVDGRHFLVVTTQSVQELLALCRSMYVNPP